MSASVHSSSCPICSQTGHSLTYCPSLRSPLKDGFQKDGGGGSHSHDDDDDDSVAILTQLVWISKNRHTWSFINGLYTRNHKVFV